MLTVGTRLGHFEIVAPIGAGGMGEVYRARDTRLDRSVAIKVIPTHLSARPDVRARFEREARAVSSLNHPHICTLFDVGHQDGLDYLVMEYLEGETLATRLTRGALPVPELLKIAMEVTGALDAAHRQGVIHRDLKPGNIMLTRTGAKLLDFGLARTAVSDSGVSSASESPTRSHPLTEEGAIVGTFQYMAPEQLEGEEADARSDIFALGAVLYEMATGKKAFEGKSRASLIAAIMEREPPPLTTVAPLAPAALERVVRRCLAKNRDDRWQSARDLGHELEWIRDDSSASGARVSTPASVAAASDSSEATPRPDSVRTGPWSARNLTLIGLGALVAVALAIRLFQPSAPRINPRMTVTPLQVPFQTISYPGMSSDGKWLALPASDGGGRWGLYIMNVKGGEPREIASDTGSMITYADISPDGSLIAYTANNGARSEVRVIPVLGGASTVIAPTGNGPHWQPDGGRIGYQIDGTSSRSGKLELWSARPDGSDRKLEFKDSLCTGANRFSFSWSPDGKRIAWLRSYERDRFQELIVRTLQGGEERQLTHDRKNIDEVSWTRQNEIVFSSNRGGGTNLWTIRASGGAPSQITQGAGPDIGMRVSADGRTLLCLQAPSSSHVWIGDLVQGVSHQVTHDDQGYVSPSLSPDHQLIAVVSQNPDRLRGGSQVLITDREGKHRRVITDPDFGPLNVDWSSGRGIVIAARANVFDPDSAWVYLVDPHDPKNPRRLGHGIYANWIDDSTLSVNRFTNSRLMRASDGRESMRSPDSTFAVPFPGGSVFEVDIRPGREGFWVRSSGTPLGDPTTRRFVGPLSLHVFDFVPPLGCIFCLDESGQPYRIRIPSLVKEPVPGTFNGLTLQSTGRVAADGKEFVYLEPSVTSRLLLIENLR
jgi:serine/threonine protein kinase/Tol biopolymer transport system component